MTTAGQICIGAGLTTVYYPIAYAKTLIQLGHEPLQPYLSTTLFGSRVYMYPNVFKYIAHIYVTDGFFGLYRGLGSKLVSFAISNSVTNAVQSKLFGKSFYVKEYEEIDDIDTSLDDFSKLIMDTTYETIARCAGIVLSQPFFVISIRSMAQFVGRETRYSSILSSIPEILNNDGILGFFAGIVPRLVGETLTIVIANFLAHAFNSLITHINQTPTNNFKTHTCMASQLIASQLTYPFTLMSVVMSANNSGLVIGSPPLMPVYSSWISCWSHLKTTNQLKRGSSLFFRRYYGPKIFTSSFMMPPMEYGKY